MILTPLERRKLNWYIYKHYIDFLQSQYVICQNSIKAVTMHKVDTLYRSILLMAMGRNLAKDKA